MELVSVDCPKCGAGLPASEPGGHYRCSYCGSVVRVEQAKTAQTQAGLAIDPHVLAEESSSSKGGVIGAVILGVIAATAGAALFVNSRIDERVVWSGVPQVVRVNGKTAVVGRTQVVADGDSLACGVYDVNGEALWRTESLGTYEGYKSTFCTAIGDAMIVSSAKGRIQILDLATGAPRKSLVLTDEVDYLCVPMDPTQSTQAWILQLDEREHLLDPATGQLTASPRPDWCFESRHAADQHLGGSWPDQTAEGPQVDGLDLDFVFIGGPTGVALGYDDPSTKVWTAVGFNHETKQVRWRQTLPSVANSLDPYGVIAGDKFIAAYAAGNLNWHIIALDLRTGERGWETKLRPISGDDSLYGLVGSDTHVFLVRTHSLDIFAVDTGVQTGTIGNETYDDEI